MVKYIQIGGEERAVSFGTLFLYNYQEQHGENPLSLLNDGLGNMPEDAKGDAEVGSAFLKVFSFKYMVDVLICGLETAAQLAERPERFTLAQVSAWIDEDGMEVLGQALGLMFESLPMGKKKPGDDPAKKKTAQAKAKALKAG